MGVELAQHVADDRRALAVLAVRVEVQVRVHRVEDPALDRLEAVAHVGQRARGDDADRVVQVAALRLGGQRRVGRRRRRVVSAAAAAALAAATAAAALATRCLVRPWRFLGGLGAGCEKIELTGRHRAKFLGP